MKVLPVAHFCSLSFISFSRKTFSTSPKTIITVFFENEQYIIQFCKKEPTILILVVLKQTRITSSKGALKLYEAMRTSYFTEIP